MARASFGAAKGDRLVRKFRAHDDDRSSGRTLTALVEKVRPLAEKTDRWTSNTLNSYFLLRPWDSQSDTFQSTIHSNGRG